MSKKGIIRLIFITSVAIIAVLLYWISKISGKATDPWNIIPQQSAIIIKIDKTSDFLSTLDQSNLIWQKIIEINQVKKLNDKLLEIDSAISLNSSHFSYLKKGSLFIALIPDSITGIEPIIIANPDPSISLSSIESNLKSNLNRDYGILDVPGLSSTLRIVNASDESSFYLSEIDGALIFTNKQEILGLAYKTYKDKNLQLSKNESLIDIKTTARTKANLSVFVNFDMMGGLLKQAIKKNIIATSSWISNFAHWSSLELLQKKNELILSGYTNTGNSSFLAGIKDQEPVRTNIFNIIPYNTNLLIWQGLSDFNSYFENTHSIAQKESITKSVNYDIDKLANIVGSEIALVSDATQQQSVENNTWFIFSVNNKDAAENILKRIALNTGYQKFTKHNNYTIRRIASKDFISNTFGNAYAEITNNYYTFINDYAVFANSERTMINLVNNYETGKTLALNDNFKAFSDNIGSRSNILVYAEPGDILGRLNNLIEGRVLRHLEINENVLNAFHGFSLQLTSSSGDRFFTNLYIKYSGAIREENLALWKTSLDFDIVHGPYLVTDHNNGKMNIIVFDKMANMYLIDADGKILWKRKLDAVPISDVWEADYYKNGKIQYLFNTPDNMYLIDKNGKNVTGYPKKLHSKATNGVSLFDYSNNKDYRILLAHSDKRIHNYTIKTTEVDGWKKPATKNIVVKPVERLVANNKDYFIITDIDNDVQIVDRRGKRRIKVSGNINKAQNSDYYVNRTNSKGIIITTNSDGKLVYISASGRLSTTDFGQFSPNHFFLYEDFNGDRSTDFIYIDGNELKVFDRFKKVLSSYTFSSNITLPPKFFSFGKNEQVLGVVADKEKTIYLFDKKGNIIVSKGLVGETPFTVGRLEGTRNLNLVSASENVLYNYLLK